MHTYTTHTYAPVYMYTCVLKPVCTVGVKNKNIVYSIINTITSIMHSPPVIV